MSKGFTLIELLIVIAVLAILAVVVILILDAPNLLQRARDTNRLSDLSTLNETLNIYEAQGGDLFGSPNIVYVSIPDPAATSTAGDECQGLGMLTLPAGWTYHCAATSTYRATDGTGWVPVNFSSLSSGSPIEKLPVDPVNTTLSRDYYTYVTSNGQWELTEAMEDSQYQLGGSKDLVSTDGGHLASLHELGNNLALEPLDYGDPSLVGYWTFDEGTGSVAYDYSGNNATGSIQGPTWTSGRYGSALQFSPGFSEVGIGNPTNLQLTGAVSICAWINTNGLSEFIAAKTDASIYDYGFYVTGLAYLAFYSGSNVVTSNPLTVSLNMWHYACVAASGDNTTFYVDGSSTVAAGIAIQNHNLYLGIGQLGSDSGYPFVGDIQDIRIYSRSLSTSEMNALYTSNADL
ncbi:MAG TPA: LamG-like jellyroll fold domain-containing protein [Bryobacteraceae bacterium]|nr:LamG-like jellyroll fold domain-containing protein [Bryobacteraceae bacterium]